MDLNKWIAIGKVDGTPQIANNGERKQASFTLIVNRRAPDAGGKWVDVPMRVPVFASDTKADLIEKYVVDGQELGLECYYMSWETNGQLHHGMVVQNVSFGFKPRTDNRAPSAAPTGMPGI